MISIIVTIIALGVIVVIHELGHMLAARRAGVGVLEFSIGMGPVVLSKQVKETLYSLRAFPFGGFVKLAGMDDAEEPVPDSLNYQLKPWYDKALIIVSGSLANIFLGFVIFVMMFWISGVPQANSKIKSVMEGSPAAEAGVLASDEIVSVSGKSVTDVTHDVIGSIRRSHGQPINFKVRRGSEEFDVTITPEKGEKGTYQIGVMFDFTIQNYALLGSVTHGWKATWGMMGGVFESLKLLITGTVSIKEMSGPVGIVQFASHGYQRSMADFMGVVALISISLGVFNLLPLPVLDGGHLVFLIVEVLRGKPLAPATQMWIQKIGITLLVSLMVFALFNDAVSWQSRSKLFGKFFK